MKVIADSRFLRALDVTIRIEDKGCIGLGMIAPVKKLVHGELANADRRNDTTINRVHRLIECVIVILETWCVPYTDYRRPCSAFETKIQPSRNSGSPAPHDIALFNHRRQLGKQVTEAPFWFEN